MKKVVTIVLGLLVFTTVTMQAQATRTWISGVGNDPNPCDRTAPCWSALAITVDGDGLVALTPISGNNDIVLPIPPNLYLNNIDTNISFQFFPGENAFDYDAATIVQAITLDTQEEWLGSVLVTNTNDNNVRGTGRVVISPDAYPNSASTTMNDGRLPSSKIEITENEVPLRTISSGATKTMRGEVKLPNVKFDAGHWPTAKANGLRGSIQTAAVRCVNGGGHGGVPCASDTVTGTSYSAPSTEFINTRLTTKTLDLMPLGRERT